MPGILKGRRRKVYLTVFSLVIVIAVVVALKQYWLFLLLIAGYYLNCKTVKKITSPKERLTARRKVEEIKTLVIGDTCPDNVLEKYCQLNNSLKIEAPMRSLASTALILDHVESVLSQEGTVVIVAPKKMNEEKISLFDLPFIGIVASKELGIERKSLLNRIPLLRHPVRSLVWLFPGGRDRTPANCPNEQIVNLCKRKGFQLVYLQ